MYCRTELDWLRFWVKTEAGAESGRSGLVAFFVQLQEQPKLSPQLRHLKQAPLRTVTWPQFGHVGASC